MVAVAGQAARGCYTNPAGIVWEVVTLSRARNLQVEGPSVPAFSWFPGYRWRLALCGGCGEHLGWRYDAVNATISPPGFWGLIPQRLG